MANPDPFTAVHRAFGRSLALALCLAAALGGCSKSEDSGDSEVAEPTEVLEGGAEVRETPASEVLQASGPETLATVSGRVVLEGDRPRTLTVPMDSNPECMEMHDGKQVRSEVVIVGAEGGLANVFVFIKAGLAKKKYATPAKAALLDQAGCMYTPHVQGIRAGQELQIRNSDRIAHNVHALAKVNREFNFGQPIPGSQIRKFRRPEEALKIKCDVHPWMSAYLFVMTHPFYAVTGRDGAFSIPDLPTGRYTLEAWHEKFGTQSVQIEVGEEGLAGLDFSFTP